MISGFDFSEKNGIIQWEKLANASHRFVYLKASESLFLLDKTFTTNRMNAKQRGWCVGAYHWLNPRLNCQLQAEKFAQTIGSTSGELPPAVCLELYRSPLNEMDRNVCSFIDTLTNLVGRKVVIYTSSTYWKTHLSKSEWASKCILWIDQPGSFFPGQLYPWSGWSFWQTSFKTLLPGIGGNFGLNWFNGSEKELQQMVTI
jgi:lysozyme